MNKNDFKNRIKVDLPKIEPVLKDKKDKNIGTRILIGMPKDEPIFRREEDIEK